MFGRKGGKDEAAAKPAAAAKAPKTAKPTATYKPVDLKADQQALETIQRSLKAIQEEIDALNAARTQEDQARSEARKKSTKAPTEADKKAQADEKARIKATRAKENEAIAKKTEKPLADAGKLAESLRAKQGVLTDNFSIPKKSEKHPNGRTGEQVQQDIANLRGVKEALSATRKAQAGLMECQKPAMQDKEAAARQARTDAKAALEASPDRKAIDKHARDLKNAKGRLAEATNAVAHPPKTQGLEGDALKKAEGKIKAAGERKERADKDVKALEAKKPEIEALKAKVKPLKDAVQAAEKQFVTPPKKKGKRGAPQEHFKPAAKLDQGIAALEKEARSIDRGLKGEDRAQERNDRASTAAKGRRAERDALTRQVTAGVLDALSGGDREVLGKLTAALMEKRGAAAEKGAGAGPAR